MLSCSLLHPYLINSCNFLDGSQIWHTFGKTRRNFDLLDIYSLTIQNNNMTFFLNYTGHMRPRTIIPRFPLIPQTHFLEKFILFPDPSLLHSNLHATSATSSHSHMLDLGITNINILTPESIFTPPTYILISHSSQLRFHGTSLQALLCI